MIDIKDFDNEYKLITLKNNNIEVVVSDYGASLISIFFTNKNGKKFDIIMGYDDISSYKNNKPFIGSIIGRYANRIENAEFNLSGKKFSLTKNDGNNCLHSGRDFYCNRKWNYEIEEDKVIFTLYSPNLDQGFYGNADISVIYSINNDNCLDIKYSIVSDEDTVFNPTNHAYFNLDGCDSRDIKNHMLKINADYFMPTDKNSIVHGDMLEVKDTPFDFREYKEIGRDINLFYETLNNAKGYDHNFVINKNDSNFVASVYSNNSKIQMDVYSDMPGMQFYTANYLDENIIGKNKIPFKSQCSYCFETQFHPNAVNTLVKPLPIVPKNTLVTSSTRYKLSHIS